MVLLNNQNKCREKIEELKKIEHGKNAIQDSKVTEVSVRYMGDQY